MGQRLVRAEIRSSVRNVKNVRTWAQRVNVRRAQSARLKNVQIYMSFRAAKQIAPITATTVPMISLSGKERNINFNYYHGERK